MSPAKYNNVIGFKPSRGLIATDGTIPISSRQDVIGSLTRTVKDAAYMLNYMADQSTENWAAEMPRQFAGDFTSFCKMDLTGVTIGIPRNTWSGTSPAPIEKSFDSALRILKSAGAKLVDSADFPEVEGFKKLNMQIRGIVRSSEFKRDIVRYIQTLDSNPRNIKSVEDIIEFTKTFPAEEYPDHDIGKFLWTQEEGVDVESEKYHEMRQQETFYGGIGGILGAMNKYNLDVIAVPADQDMANDLAAKMGYPVISVPLGFWPEGTPVKKENNNLVKVAPGMPYVSPFQLQVTTNIIIKVLYPFYHEWISRSSPAQCCLRF
jgi:amidase